MIIGAKSIALDYVIRQNDAPDLSGQANWEERDRIAAPHAGNTYRMNTLAVHRVILRNIAESSDAYTYVKTNIRLDDGRVDIKALRVRYENPAMQDMHINEAKKTLSNIAYHKERLEKMMRQTFPVKPTGKKGIELQPLMLGIHTG